MTFHGVLAKPDRCLIGQLGNTYLDFIPALKVFGEGAAISNGLGRCILSGGGDRGAVLPAGKVVELNAIFPQKLEQLLTVKGGQIANGAYSKLLEGLRRRSSYIKKVGYRERPDNFFEIFPGNDRSGIRLFIVAAQFGEYLVEGHPHRNSQPKAASNLAAQPVRQGGSVAAENVEASSHVQPAFVYAERFHQIGVFLIKFVDFPGKIPVNPVVGGEEDQIRALLSGLPDGLRRFDVKGFGRFVFGQNDAVTAGRVAAYGYRFVPQFRVGQQFYRGVKAVQVAMENDALHRFSPLSAMVHAGRYRPL